jgi:L-alanine-DL-glutamate epimerase-like enolase superfamily enzyme
MPHVSLYLLLENDLIVEPLVVSDGYAKAPAKPGLGVEIDEDAVEKYRIG